MKFIPIIITCLNLLIGCTSIVQILKFENYKNACFFIFLSCILDFLDGLFARLLKSQSALGKELDSLADIVSFGVAPSCIVYSFLSSSDSLHPIVAYFAFFLTIFSALRLANFNLNTCKKFVGLPVPACCLFWVSFISDLHPNPNLILNILILGLISIFCFLMISSFYMISIKFENLYWKNNKYSYSIFLIACLLIGIFFLFHTPYFGVSLTIVAYIILSIVKQAIEKNV